MAETLADCTPASLRRIGYRDVWVHSGFISQILDHHGLRPAVVAAAAREAMAAREGGVAPC